MCVCECVCKVSEEHAHVCQWFEQERVGGGQDRKAGREGECEGVPASTAPQGDAQSKPGEPTTGQHYVQKVKQKEEGCILYEKRS